MAVATQVITVFSLTRWMETVLYSQMFYAIFQFCTQVKFGSLYGNIANDDLLPRFKLGGMFYYSQFFSESETQKFRSN